MPTSRKSSKTDTSVEANAQPITDDAKPTSKANNKTTLLTELLNSDTGATISQIADATGWLPHSARAALTGLRNKGHSITRTSMDGTTTYRIVERTR